MNNNNNSNHSVNVIEQFLKNLSPLPGTVRTNMAQIRKLDAECQSSSKEAQNTIKHLFNSWKSKGRDNKKKNYESIEKLFSKMSQLSDEKIKIAEQTYELVDKYIVKLDRDTEKFNIYAKRKMGENSNLHKVSFEPNKSGNKKRRFDSTSSTTEGKRSMKKNKMTLSVMESEEPATSSVFLGPISGDIAHLSDVPVDPNEPTYCYCKQVSFGQMVMCDNKNCPIEWFHFQCVGLASIPRGKWFCNQCSEAKKRK